MKQGNRQAIIGALAATLAGACQERQYLSLEEVEGMTLTREATQREGYEYYVLQFDQPVDHRNPEGARFSQRVSLLHRDVHAPMVVLTTGYDDYYYDHTHELTAMLGANQISIEHRFFGSSLPAGDDVTHLTIEQMAHDQHQIIAKLSDVYRGAFLSTGHSKGGMTATYHRRFYPEDVVGTVAYVAPMSFGLGDPRYPSFQDSIGPKACRDAVREAVIEMLRNRRAALRERAILKLAGEGYEKSRSLPESAVYSTLLSLEWTYWQYSGAEACPLVPHVDASDDEMWAFLELVSPLPTDGREQRLSPYYVQTRNQLGYPAIKRSHLKYYYWQNLDGGPILPAGGAPQAKAIYQEDVQYDGGAAMRDIHRFITTESEDLVFIYGQWDPWTGGKYELGKARDSAFLVQAGGSHDARIKTLDDTQRRAVYQKLEQWTGVAPVPPPTARMRGHELPRAEEPRVPPGPPEAFR